MEYPQLGESRVCIASRRLAWAPVADYISSMCGRVIQSSGPLRYAIVDGMNLRDSRVHNYPPRWNAAPSQELLGIRRNHRTGEVSGSDAMPLRLTDAQLATVMKVAALETAPTMPDSNAAV
jgi:hypothetical protein